MVFIYSADLRVKLHSTEEVRSKSIKMYTFSRKEVVRSYTIH